MDTRAHLGPIWYHSEPSDVPYSPNQFLGWDFFCCFLQQGGSSGQKLLFCYAQENMIKQTTLKSRVDLQICRNLTAKLDPKQQTYKFHLSLWSTLYLYF